MQRYAFPAIFGDEMKNKFLVFIALVVFGISLNAKENFRFTPEKPKAGDAITVVYNSLNTPLANSKSINLVYTAYSTAIRDGYLETKSIEMQKAGDEWKAIIKTNAKAEIVVVKFENGEGADNNSGEGYFVRFYDNSGNETAESKLCYASAFDYWGTAYDYVSKDYNKAYELMKKQLNEVPRLKLSAINQFTGLIDRVIPENQRENLTKKELVEFEKLDDGSEQFYQALVYLYNRLKMTEKAEQTRKISIAKYPTGMLAVLGTSRKLNTEKDFEKQKKLALEIQKIYPYSDLQMLPPTTTVFDNILKQGNADLLKDWWKTMRDSSLLSPRTCYRFIQRLLEANKGLEVAADIYETGINNADKEEMVKRYDNAFRYYPAKQVAALRKSDLANLRIGYAQVLNKLNNKKEALNKYEEAFSLQPVNKFEDKTISEYLTHLVDSQKYEQALNVCGDAVKSGIMTGDIKNLCKEAYTKKNNNDTGFEDYYNKLKDAGRVALNTMVKKQMISKPAPNFTLTDLEGKKVSLSDYKGKIVVLDFWATWCHYCVEGFPGMQKLVDQYKNGNEVVFLLINTWEHSDDKKKLVEDFFQKKPYRFHVLMDYETKVVNEFNVGALPTKFVIDKKGNIRFVEVEGLAGDAVVEYISAMIKLAGEN